MKWKDIQTSAVYEAKLVYRSFLFGILCLLAVGGIAALLWFMHNRFSSLTWDWLFHHQTFSLPLVYAYLYNLVQALMLIFVVSEVFHREQQQGPLESLHVRPVDNSSYLIGKVTGVVSVFLAVALLSLLVCCGLNLWGCPLAPFSFSYYLYYFVAQTIPSLLFFTGLTFYVTWITRSKAFALLLLLAYLYLSATWLPGVFHGLFDFTAIGLPNVFSVATGHVAGRVYALHRLAYAFAGIGFICWTVSVQKRLPNRLQSVPVSRYGGMIFLLVGLLLGGWLAREYLNEREIRENYRAAFSRHAHVPSCRVTHHDIYLQQQGERLQSCSRLTVRNPHQNDISRLVLYLNPGLEILSLEENGKPLSFKRDEQVIEIERLLRARESVTLTLRYEGEPDERVCYLEIDPTRYNDTRRGGNFFHLGQRHAFVSESAMLLIPEMMWYPMAVAPVHVSHPELTERDYTRYRLAVIRPVQPVVLSQGEREQRGDTLVFHASRPLAGISLCGGTYERATFRLESVDVELFYFKESDFITPLLEGVSGEQWQQAVSKDIRNAASGGVYHLTMTKTIADFIVRRDWFDGQKGRLLVVETPLPFVSYSRSWKGHSEYMQPGLLLLGERAMGMNMHAYSLLLRNNPKESESSRLFKRAAMLSRPLLTPEKMVNQQNPFLKRLGLYEAYTGDINTRNPYDALPLLLEPTVSLISSRYPTVDRVLKFITSKGEKNKVKSSIVSDVDFQALLYLQRHTLDDAMQDQTLEPYFIQKVIELKSRDLLNRIEDIVPCNQFLQFLHSFYASHYGEIPLDTLNRAVQMELGMDFVSILDDWQKKTDVSFRVQDLKLERLENAWGYIVSFRVQNTGKQPGRIVGEFGGDMSRYSVTVQPGECKQVRWKGYANSFVLDLGLADNFPSAINLIVRPARPGSADRMPCTNDTTTGAWTIPVSACQVPSGEIIVDNEDQGFQLIVPQGKKFRDYFFTDKNYVSYWGGTAPRMGRWTKVYAAEYYGERYKSVYMKTRGTGNFKAEWTTEIPEEGNYEIFVMHPEMLSLPPKKQYYTVRGEDKEDEEILSDYVGGTWHSLGIFPLKRGKASVILDDRAPNKEKTEQEKRSAFGETRIIADAVKWVRVKR